MSSKEKQCFVTCAIGDRYAAYHDSLIQALSAYSNGVEVVEIDHEMLAEAFPSLSESDRPYFARIAAPMVERFRDYDRIIWVDADVDVVSRGFQEILEADVGPDGVAAALDIDQHARIEHMRRRFPEYNRQEYYNIGVMVIDLGVISHEEWRRRVEEVLLSRFVRPVGMLAQDIVNLKFAVSRLDQRYNWIWRLGVDAVRGAFAVHYCDPRGHENLEEVINMRKDAEAENKQFNWKDRCVVVSPRHSFIRPWIRAYFATGNTTPLIIVPGPPGDWQPGDMEYCQKAAESCGGMVFDCSAEWENSKRLAERAVLKSRIGWFTKKNILRAVAAKLAPKSWAWIDDDAEVTGNLDECFEYAERSPGFICTQFYRPDSIDNRHPAAMYRSNIDTGDKICWNSLVFFHGEASERLAEDLNRDFPVEDDEIVFGHLYQTDPRWHEAFCDFSIRNWQVNCKRIDQIPKYWSGKLLHYTAHQRGSEVKNMWAAKADKIPKAPFEVVDPAAKAEESSEDGPVDAVFIIGSGSIGNNEELRYALRNLAEHCHFVRNVFICGFCPPWVDKAVVKHLQWPDRFRHAKDANIIDKLRHACEYPGIAKKILFCSDDQFQTRDCSWEDFRPRYLRRYMSNDDWYENRHRVWHSRLRKTLERDVQRRRDSGLDADHVFYYQPHIWMPIDRDKFIEYAKWCNYEHRDDTIIASGYFNFIDAEGTPDFDHTFLGHDASKVPSTTHVAYHDGSYKSAMNILRSMFPHRCRFELGGEDAAPDGPIPEQIRHVNATGCTSQSLGADVTACDYSGAMASKDELDDILMTTASVRDNPMLHPLLGEISRAEELRLFGVKGWRVVWNDIIRRWRKSVDGRMSDPMLSPRSQAASEVVVSYLADPERMRTVRFGQHRPAAALDPNAGLRERVRTSLLGRA